LKGEKDEAEQTYKRLAAMAGKYKHVYGVYLYQEGKRDAAIVEFEKLVRRDRRDVTDRTRLVVAYLNAGRLPDVEKVLAAALKDNPKDAVALVERSEIEIGKGQLDQAQIDIESVLKFQSDSAEAHYILSAIHHARGAELSRRDELARAVRLQPSMLQARLELAQCYIAQKQPKAALDALDAAAPSQQQTVGAMVQRNWALAELQDWVALRKGIDQGLALSRTVDLLLQDGMLRMQQADYAGARKSFEEGLKQNPEDVRLLKAMAGTWVAQKQPAMALAAIREYASQRPKSAGLQYFLGEWLLASNSPEQARTAFRAAKAADPGFIQADLAMARLDSSTGNDAASRRELMELLAKRGEDARVRLMLGAIEESANNTTEAIAHYRKALETDPKNLMALNNLAFLLTGIGDLDEALQLAQKATEIAPAEPVVEDTLGWAMYCKGMYRAAIPHLESAFSKHAIPRTQYHLAMAYVRVGRDQQARQAYVAAMKADPNLPEAKMAATVIASGARF
jgi:tetratricopeptide (TPR) repeat protein